MTVKITGYIADGWRFNEVDLGTYSKARLSTAQISVWTEGKLYSEVFAIQRPSDKRWFVYGKHMYPVDMIDIEEWPIPPRSYDGYRPDGKRRVRCPQGHEYDVMPTVAVPDGSFVYSSIADHCQVCDRAGFPGDIVMEDIEVAE